jgi:hypothetical protein
VFDAGGQLRSDRQCDADAVGLFLRKDDGGVDADDPAVDVEERSTGVAGVDLRRGLNQPAVQAVFALGKLGKRAVEGADDADRDALIARA